MDELRDIKQELVVFKNSSVGAGLPREARESTPTPTPTQTPSPTGASSAQSHLNTGSNPGGASAGTPTTAAAAAAAGTSSATAKSGNMSPLTIVNDMLTRVKGLEQRLAACVTVCKDIQPKKN